MSKTEKEARKIASLVKEGKMTEKDLLQLPLYGLNPESVDYYFEHVKGKEDNMTSDVTQLIDKLTNAISFKFKEDGTSPNLTISKLRHGYYCSVVRYAKGVVAPKNKVVVCKAEADTLEGAVKGVVSEFLRTVKVQPDPVQELDNLVKSSK